MKYKDILLESRFLFYFHREAVWSVYDTVSLTDINACWGYNKIGGITKDLSDDILFDFEYWVGRQIALGVFNSEKVWQCL